MQPNAEERDRALIQARIIRLIHPPITLRNPRVLNETHTATSTITRRRTVTVLKTALGDLSPQILAYVIEKAMVEGALDVMLTPGHHEKGRPARF
jgi:uncharacterized protein (DUF111 family)